MHIHVCVYIYIYMYTYRARLGAARVHTASYPEPRSHKPRDGGCDVIYYVM